MFIINIQLCCRISYTFFFGVGYRPQFWLVISAHIFAVFRIRSFFIGTLLMRWGSCRFSIIYTPYMSMRIWFRWFLFLATFMSVQDQGPLLACCAHGFDRECRLLCSARQHMRYTLGPYVQSKPWPLYLPHHHALYFLLRSCTVSLALSSTISAHICRFQVTQFRYKHALVMRWGSRRFSIRSSFLFFCS